MHFDVSSPVEKWRATQIEYLTDLAEEDDTSPAEDVLALGRGFPRALVVRRWTSVCLTLVVGFALGRVPADLFASSSGTPSAVSSAASPGAAPRGDPHRVSHGGSHGGSHRVLHRVSAPDVTGLNSRRQLGHYDRRGHWHQYRGYVSSTEAENLVHVLNPITHTR